MQYWTLFGACPKNANSANSSSSAGCIWADDFAVQTLARKLSLAFIINEGTGRSGSPSLLTVRPEGLEPTSFVILQRTCRVHYNLIELQGRPLALLATLPCPAATALGLALHASGTTSPGGVGAGHKDSGVTGPNNRGTGDGDARSPGSKISKGVVVLFHPECDGHDTSGGGVVHQEAADRTAAALVLLRQVARKKGAAGLQGRVRFSSEFGRATREMVDRVHSAAYLDLLEASMSPPGPVEEEVGGLTPRIVAAGILGEAGAGLKGRPSMTPLSPGTYA